MPRQRTLAEHCTREAYCFVPRKRKLWVLSLLRAALYSRCVAASYKATPVTVLVPVPQAPPPNVTEV